MRGCKAAALAQSKPRVIALQQIQTAEAIKQILVRDQDVDFVPALLRRLQEREQDHRCQIGVAGQVGARPTCKSSRPHTRKVIFPHMIRRSDKPQLLHDINSLLGHFDVVFLTELSAVLHEQQQLRRHQERPVGETKTGQGLRLRK